MPEDILLSIRGLQTSFYLKDQEVRAINGIDLDIRRGRVTAIIGGSGSGKSVTALSILNLIDHPGKIIAGHIQFEGQELLSFSERSMQKIRGKEIAMIFQEPQSAMNPTLTVKSHLQEVLRRHRRGVRKKEALALFIDVLTRVGFRQPEKLLNSYPFELSGGMCQRIMVAMGLLAQVKLLIADEPTASLDLTTQAAILKELHELKAKGISVIIITHDLGVVAQIADDVYVMYNGHIVDSGTVEQLFDAPKHHYSQRLLQSRL